MNKTNTLQIRTPEGVVFSQQLAGPVTRFIAWLIDFATLMAVILLLTILLEVLSIVGGEFIGALSIILFFLLNLGYGIVLEWRWRGQTLGKRAMRLRVVDAEGLRLRFNQVVIRNLLRAVDMLPFFYLVGGLAHLLNRRAQRLGDFAANTVVIRIPRIATPNLDQITSGKYNSFREHPHLEARLRQRVTAAEAALALQAIVRRDSLEPASRVALLGDLAAHFRQIVPFPPESVESMADEQYIRNVLDTLHRKQASGAGRRPGPISDTTTGAPASDALDAPTASSTAP